MGYPLPAENYRGYQEGSLIDRAKNIRGKAFLLAHGMADRNVHFQNSILLAKALVNHNIPFEQHVSVFIDTKSSFATIFIKFCKLWPPT
jgi:dipeptidyl aminopeptidase/acylaminoacyl peptidase